MEYLKYKILKLSDLFKFKTAAFTFKLKNQSFHYILDAFLHSLLS